MEKLLNIPSDADDLLFLDTFTHGLDAQCRVSLPSEWRRDGGMDFVLFAIEDRSLALMPQKLFRSFLTDAQKQVITNPEVRRAFSSVAGRAKPCRYDKQGRMALSREMLDRIGVRDQLTMIGSFSFIRLASPEYAEKLQSDFSDDVGLEFARLQELKEPGK